MPPKDVLLFVDETGTDGKSSVVAVACAVVDSAEEVRRTLDALRAEVQGDYFLKKFQSVESLRENGFHFTADHPEIRARVIAGLKEIPFDGYISFARKTELSLDADYQWYAMLLDAVLADRLRDNVHKSVGVVVERIGSKASRIAEEVVQRAVERVSQEMRPFVHPPMFGHAGKEESCLVLADYIAGVFREAIEKGGDTALANFYRLRPRIRLVRDVPRGVFYSRRNELPLPLPP